MDPLSDVLALLKLRSFWCAGFDFGGDWSIALDPEEGIRFYAAVHGECWLAVDGVAEPVRIRAGDCLLLPRKRAAVVASDLALAPVDPATVVTGAKDGGVSTINGGGDFSSIGGQFALDGDRADMLVDLLPPIVHVKSEADKTSMRWAIERMRAELRDPQPGGFLVAQQLAMTILVQALRVHLASGIRGGVGWLFALADPQMAAAIGAIHADPAARWTVRALAERAGMSRTTFTQRFKETVGTSPVEYLTRWRMLLAADRLATSGEAVSAIAFSLGYESESAFGNAFKRVMGASPRRYGRDRDERLASIAI